MANEGFRALLEGLAPRSGGRIDRRINCIGQSLFATVASGIREVFE